VGSEQAVDNDVLLKALSYGIEARVWPESDDPPDIAVLGAARFVVGGYLAGANLGRDPDQALGELLARAEELEPTEPELECAAEIERAAQDRGLELDGGESQLAAMALERGFQTLETGDKRAIAAFEQLMTEVGALADLAGRLRCLEQIVHRLASQEEFDFLASAICGAPAVDKSLTICFSCHSGGAGQDSALEALLQYIEDVRGQAPKLLEAGP
jgi:predicted nucleic acid-binding protein